MKKILVICGPTATGKTAVAFDLARQCNGELISADSRQVYRGMDIVTGKQIDPKIKTWLIDVISPDEQFSASDYYHMAWEAIEDIWERKKLPIVVGGTGFYIKALIDGIDTMGIVPDQQLRKKLSELSLLQLQNKLEQVDPIRWKGMNKSDRMNPRRLVRAIEVASQIHLGGVASQHLRGGRMDSSEVDILWIGITAVKPLLYRRIDRRIDQRMIGGIIETKALAKKYGWDVSSMTGIGYKQLRGYLAGAISRNEAGQKWKFAEHAYARKQMTFFKKEKRIIWFEAVSKNFRDQITRWVTQWYN